MIIPGNLCDGVHDFESCCNMSQNFQAENWFWYGTISVSIVTIFMSIMICTSARCLDDCLEKAQARSAQRHYHKIPDTRNKV